jgi:hypothetical protein
MPRLKCINLLQRSKNRPKIHSNQLDLQISPAQTKPDIKITILNAIITYTMDMVKSIDIKTFMF